MLVRANSIGVCNLLWKVSSFVDEPKFFFLNSTAETVRLSESQQEFARHSFTSFCCSRAPIPSRDRPRKRGNAHSNPSTFLQL